MYIWKTLVLMLGWKMDSISIYDCGHVDQHAKILLVLSNLSFTEWVAAAAVAAAAMNTDKPWF